MIEDGQVKFIQHTEEKECRIWCEGFYTIDFSKGEFITEWDGEITTFKLNELPTNEEYLKITELECLYKIL